MGDYYESKIEPTEGMEELIDDLNHPKKVYKVKMQCKNCGHIAYKLSCPKCGHEMFKYKNPF
jgi:rubrerythrin